MQFGPLIDARSDRFGGAEDQVRDAVAVDVPGHGAISHVALPGEVDHDVRFGSKRLLRVSIVIEDRCAKLGAIAVQDDDVSSAVSVEVSGREPEGLSGADLKFEIGCGGNPPVLPSEKDFAAGRDHVRPSISVHVHELHPEISFRLAMLRFLAEGSVLVLIEQDEPAGEALSDQKIDPPVAIEVSGHEVGRPDDAWDRNLPEVELAALRSEKDRLVL